MLEITKDVANNKYIYKSDVRFACLLWPVGNSCPMHYFAVIRIPTQTTNTRQINNIKIAIRTQFIELQSKHLIYYNANHIQR